MSADEEKQVGQLDVATIKDLSIEPSYVSEIARKLRENKVPLGYNIEDAEELDEFDRTWDDISFNAAINLVASILGGALSADDSDIEKERPEYDVEAESSGLESQQIGSAHTSVKEPERQNEWELYSVYKTDEPEESVPGGLWDKSGHDDIGTRIREAIDPSITMGDKIQWVKDISRRGNRMSRRAERIMQDVMERQFRNYEEVVSSDYNDMGPDFLVYDENNRQHGLIFEVSTRWVNPIGEPYIDEKVDEVLELEGGGRFEEGVYDLIIAAPKFTDHALQKYEDSDIVHLEQVPGPVSLMYRQYFSQNALKELESEDEGSPVILPDGRKARERLSGPEGHVGDRYPVIDRTDEEYLTLLEDLLREHRAVTESGYRVQLREALEGQLEEFQRPYTIEQYLNDLYWEEGLSSKEIGRLAGSSGRTIRRWMNEQHWDIATRGRVSEAEQERKGGRVTPRTLEVWKAMYEGKEPFNQERPGGLSANAVQALYSRHPTWSLDDWKDWYSWYNNNERRDLMSRVDTSRSGYSYTLMFGPEDNITPSPDFIRDVLRANGVDIREGYFGTIEMDPTQKSLQYLINRNEGRLDQDGRGIKFRSSMELQIGEWFSDNEIPYAHEPFTIPSIYAAQGAWNEIRSNLSAQEGVVSAWEDIYNKHALDEDGDVGVDEGLELLSKTEIVPDFVTYPDAGSEARSEEWEGWDDWGHIIEYAGPWGMEIIGEDWSSWYRVRQVAYKELVLRLMGLWDDTIFIIPNNDGLTEEIRGDDHYVIVNHTQSSIGLEQLVMRLR